MDNRELLQLKVEIIVRYCQVIPTYSHSFSVIDLTLKIVELKRYCNKSYLEILNILDNNNLIPLAHYKELLRLYNKQQHFIDSLLS